MTIYHLNAKDYFDNLFDERFDEYSRPYYEYTRYENAMTQLIEKYNLQNKMILSIGSGYGVEEYWFYKTGSSLFLVDIDEQTAIERNLKKLPLNDIQESTLTYFIEDANVYLQKYSERKFDAIFFSSFTLDEQRRGKIKDDYAINKNRTVFSRIKNKIISDNNIWPKDKLLYSDLSMDLAKKNLKIGGFFISQSYCAGVDYKNNPYIIDIVKHQFAQNGMTLLKIYCWKTLPAISLTIGLMNQNLNVKKYLDRIRNNKDISQFHARADAGDRRIDLIYDIDTQKSPLY